MYNYWSSSMGRRGQKSLFLLPKNPKMAHFSLILGKRTYIGVESSVFDVCAYQKWQKVNKKGQNWPFYDISTSFWLNLPYIVKMTLKYHKIVKFDPFGWLLVIFDTRKRQKPMIPPQYRLFCLKISENSPFFKNTIFDPQGPHFWT